jgi:DNA-binding response OmpR family regulator
MILIAEDNNTTGGLLYKEVKKFADVECVDTVKEGIKALKKNPFVLVTDVYLKDGEAFDLAKEAKEQGIKVIVITAGTTKRKDITHDLFFRKMDISMRELIASVRLLYNEKSDNLVS